MVETIYTTPTGVKLLKNGYGMLFSSNIVEVKVSLTKDTYSDDYYKSMTAVDLLDEIDHQTTLKPKIEKTNIDGIVSNGHHLLSGLDPDDGYGKIWPSLERCNNTFDPIEVYVQWEKYDYRPNDNDDENYCDVYMVIISYNSKIIAKMGTRRYEIRDWTPIFVVDKDFSLN